jgi:transposase-like protein
MTDMNDWTLPDEMRHRAIALRGAGDYARWRAGDLLDEAVAESPRGCQMYVIRTLAGDLGIATSTARKWLRVARAYDGAARTEYGDVLTHECYAIALMDAEPMAMLRWAVESADDYGGAISPADRIRAEVIRRRNGETASAMELYQRALRRLERAAEQARVMAERAGKVSFYLATIQADIGSLLKKHIGDGE